MQVCKQCGKNFEISPEDIDFYQKISPVFSGKKYFVPVPKMCPLCRHQRRLSFRNERKLYTRKSDLSGKTIISIYSPDKPYKVYDQDEWWSDKWDPMEYGRDFDFNKSFSEQFRALYVDVPRVSLHTIGNENSYFSCYTLYLKNCYLLFGASYNEDSMYGKYVTRSKNVLDALVSYNNELCYEVVASDSCYGCRYILNCRNCVDLLMCEDLSGCKNCVACFGLRNKEYCFFNKFVGEEKFSEIKEQYKILNQEKIKFLTGELEKLKSGLPHIQSHIYASEGCNGDAIFNCKNCVSCFDVKDCEDCKFLYNTPNGICSYDGVYSAPGPLHFCYNTCSTVGTNLMVTYFVWYCDNVFYSMDCLNSTNLFGCVGLRNRNYCVFNKQYSREEYEKLVPKIIEHMGKTGEWGEYFPYDLAPCCYNETVAQEYFPLSKDEVLALGSSWHEEEKADQNGGEQILTCEISGKKYKILPAELQFYQKMGVPIPLRCPDQRHYDRLEKHGFVRTFAGKCAKCGLEIQTIYSSESEEVVYCEKCYLAEIY